MNNKEIHEKLIKNLRYIQRKIDDISSREHIDIKQISDLQRYVEMQKNIIQSLALLKTGVE